MDQTTQSTTHGSAPTASRRSLRQRGRTVLRRAIALFTLWLSVHVAAMLWFGLHDDLRPADAAVVLGNWVEADGSPGPLLKVRLDRALEVYHARLVKKFIVSGATWGADYNEPAAMKRYLIANGVPAADIIEDEFGSNTYHTALNARITMRAREIETVMIISDFYHIMRTRLAFSLAGIDDARSAHSNLPPQWGVVYWIGRETVAFYRYLFHDYRAQGVIGR
ncbi:MAG: YdcF family protein [Planctomycetes bacterium]|nr:YdcF family protein [Planctomycetota bacterium]